MSDSKAKFIPTVDHAELRNFPSRQATSSPATSYGSAGSETYISEVFGLGKLNKIGLVEETSTGRTWCLQSDEGASLGGTNLAPAPLLQWLAGLQADVAFRLAALVRSRGKRLDRLMVVASQRFASAGSFAKGTAVAQVFELGWDVDLQADITDAEAAELFQSALRTSPAVAAMQNVQPGVFALHTNGQSTAVDGLEVWAEPDLVDPLRRYAAMPTPTDESFESVFEFVDGGGELPAAAGVVIGETGDVPVGFRVEARGELDLATDLMMVSAGFPGRSSDRWRIISDSRGEVAPTPLALFAIGSAFCYHTQLSRYVNVRRLPLQNSSLAQTTRYESSDPEGKVEARADAIQTNVFLNGHVTNEQSSDLLRVAANTCYVHRAMGVQVSVSTNSLTAESSR